MKTLLIEITLEADVVQTADGASEGVHHSLDYLRGGTLLGAAAARYGDFGAHAFDAFHSGAVRFCDGLPLDDGDRGATTTPVPLAWMHQKDDPWYDDDKGTILADALSVLCRGRGDASGGGTTPALQQVRGGYFTDHGRRVQPELRYRLKTAVNRASRGRPEDGQLFGYEALAAGSRWLARVELDDGVDPQVEALLRQIFDQKTVWLGRSRGAEYGRARCRLVEPEGKATADPGGTTGEVVIFAASDLCLLHPETGQPTLTARAEHFGLPQGYRLDPLRSAVTTRSYAPYNAKRQGHDPRRSVIKRGSVLCFVGGPAMDLDQQRRTLRRGVGLHRAEGLGRLRINPWFLAAATPSFSGNSTTRLPGGVSTTPVGKPNTPFAQMMERRAKEAAEEKDTYQAARAAADELHKQQQRLQRRGDPVPTRSQWQQLAGLGKLWARQAAPEKNDFKAALADLLPLDGRGGGVGGNAWRGKVSGDQTLAAITVEQAVGDKSWPITRQARCLAHTAARVAQSLSRHRDRR